MLRRGRGQLARLGGREGRTGGERGVEGVRKARQGGAQTVAVGLRDEGQFPGKGRRGFRLAAERGAQADWKALKASASRNPASCGKPRSASPSRRSTPESPRMAGPFSRSATRSDTSGEASRIREKASPPNACNSLPSPAASRSSSGIASNERRNEAAAPPNRVSIASSSSGSPSAGARPFRTPAPWSAAEASARNACPLMGGCPMTKSLSVARCAGSAVNSSMAARESRRPLPITSDTACHMASCSTSSSVCCPLRGTCRYCST